MALQQGVGLRPLRHSRVSVADLGHSDADGTNIALGKLHGKLYSQSNGYYTTGSVL